MLGQITLQQPLAWELKPSIALHLALFNQEPLLLLAMEPDSEARLMALGTVVGLMAHLQFEVGNLQFQAWYKWGTFALWLNKACIWCKGDVKAMPPVLLSSAG